MKTKDVIGRHYVFLWHLALPYLLAGSILQGCFGPLTVNRAMMEYDQSVSEAEKNILLLNIARVSDSQPPHFTIANTVNAQFSFSSNGSIVHTLFSAGLSSDTTQFTLGATITEQPTLTLGPVQGEEFVKRSFRPFESSVYNIFLSQDGAYLAPLLQLTTTGFFLFHSCFFPKPAEDCPHPIVGRNQPSSLVRSDRESAWQFRKLTEYLDELQKEGSLAFEFLEYKEPVGGVLAQGAVEQAQIIAAADKGYQWIPSHFANREGEVQYALTKPQRANLVLTNIRGPIKEEYKPILRLLRDSEPYPEALILILLKDDVDDTVYKGYFRLRNLYETLRFIAAGVGNYPLSTISKTSFIELKALYPEFPLVVRTGDVVPENAVRAVKYKNKYYWLSDEPTEYRPRGTDEKMFTLLYHLSQMVMTEPKVFTPVLTLGTK